MAIEALMSRPATAKPSLNPPRALIPAAALAVLLFLAQLGVLLHELGHDAAVPDAYCALCIATQHVGDAVPPPVVVAATGVRALALPVPRPAPAAAAPPRFFLARAPPAPALH